MDSYSSDVSYHTFHIYILCFFLNDTATTDIYTLSLHDALPICTPCASGCCRSGWSRTWCCSATRSCTSWATPPCASWPAASRSEEHTSELRHRCISYAVFCLKKKNKHDEYEISTIKTSITHC